MEPKIIKDFNEWNEIIDNAIFTRTKFRINQRLSNLHLRLINKFGREFSHYIFSVSGNEPEYEPNVLSIPSAMSPRCIR